MSKFVLAVLLTLSADARTESAPPGSSSSLESRIAADHRRLLEHPDDAATHSAYARDLLDAAAGEAARAEALRSIELESNAGRRDWATLNWVRSRDGFGRYHRLGFDRAGVIEADRRAILDAPEMTLDHCRLASDLLLDDHGRSPTANENLEEALAEYRFVNPKTGHRECEQNFVRDLFDLGRPRDIVELGPRIEDMAYLLEARAELVGPEIAIKRTKSAFTTTEKLQEAEASAGRLLAGHRRYPEASRMLLASIQGSIDPLKGPAYQYLVAVHRAESMPLSDDDPTGVAFRFLWRSFGINTPENALEKIAARARIATPSENEINRAVRTLIPALLGDLRHPAIRDAAGILPVDLTGAFGSMATALDLIVSQRTVVVEGTETAGYRVSIGYAARDGHREAEIFVTREADGYRVFCVQGEQNWIGTRIRQLIDNHDLSGARQWLAWAAQDRRDAADSALGISWVKSGTTDDAVLRHAAEKVIRQPEAAAIAAAKAESDSLISAEADDLESAVQKFRASLDAHDDVPTDAAWYLIGRIYERIALRPDAIQAYGHIDLTDSASEGSVAHLARQRLQALGAIKPK